jgi:hypothetical protein
MIPVAATGHEAGPLAVAMGEHPIPVIIPAVEGNALIAGPYHQN